MHNPTLFLKISAVTAVLCGSFLLLGGWGHLQAMLPRDGVNFGMWVPVIILGGAGVINVLSSYGLWKGSSVVLEFALGATLAAMLWLLFLLIKGVPDHPIALFNCLVAVHLVMLFIARGQNRRA